MSTNVNSLADRNGKPMFLQDEHGIWRDTRTGLEAFNIEPPSGPGRAWHWRVGQNPDRQVRVGDRFTFVVETLPDPPMTVREFKERLWRIKPRKRPDMFFDAETGRPLDAE